MAYEALPGHGVVFVFLSSFREMAVHDCPPTDSHEEMLSANSRKCSHLPSAFWSEKYPLPMRTLHFALQFSLSLGALLSMCFIARFLFFYTNKPTAVIESQGSEANLPGSKPQLCLSQAVWPLLRFPHLHIENVSGICFRMLGGSNERVKHLEC